MKIGVFPTLAPYLLPIIIPKLAKAYPKLSFYLIEEQTPNLIEKLKQGSLHAAVLAFPVTEKNFSYETLFEEEFMLATAANHPLSKLKTIKQQHLENKNLLLLEEGHCLRDQALALCHKLNATEAQNFKATSLETLRHMVLAGVGITLMPKLACNQNNNITYIPFNTPKPSRKIGLFWRSSSVKQQVLMHIALKIKSILAKHQVVKIINSDL